MFHAIINDSATYVHMLHACYVNVIIVHACVDTVFTLVITTQQYTPTTIN